jgi:hypothetical protein
LKRPINNAKNAREHAENAAGFVLSAIDDVMVNEVKVASIAEVILARQMKDSVESPIIEPDGDTEAAATEKVADQVGSISPFVETIAALCEQ